MSEDQDYILTRAGYEALQQQLEDYQQRLDDQMEDMESIQGDMDEHYPEPGAEFDARTRREFLDERIGNLKLILSNADVIEEDPDPRKINPGERVTVWNAAEKQEFQYDLIGSAEVQYGLEGVSIESPVGSALLGKQVGDVVEVETPDGMVRYVIRGVEPIPQES